MRLWIGDLVEVPVGSDPRPTHERAMVVSVERRWVQVQAQDGAMRRVHRQDVRPCQPQLELAL